MPAAPSIPRSSWFCSESSSDSKTWYIQFEEDFTVQFLFRNQTGMSERVSVKESQFRGRWFLQDSGLLRIVFEEKRLRMRRRTDFLSDSFSSSSSSSHTAWPSWESLSSPLDLIVPSEGGNLVIPGNIEDKPHPSSSSSSSRRASEEAQGEGERSPTSSATSGGVPMGRGRHGGGQNFERTPMYFKPVHLTKADYPFRLSEFAKVPQPGP
uniref:Uncharacterized protein n=1 Tax=Chromera velia CCMP2878 TaxID=1169474 RepID=A0A0G4HZY8_9ALVE|mmetsp:Transcript_4460/g.8986  ORF Transcript_4460/g.8986 Transcript_4460/m.8986 type:complete len:210 (-) Transcript_4460:1487-2116(-)|eukprot:Cvel_9838.t1-p1 / transcript=Cvel_9838.t1 / gene=Cvel_9838 / organism=Chromera_velia_CCMP2878 / gene_product=hypothetical protein / transcript_product=hypothetical protein / location=Cvel_scaffold579:45725-46351(+) / protein_length=209 / sequence_SO=supercontig / SO=protein_coding / is_pseudo=false